VAAVYFTHSAATKGEKPPSLGSLRELGERARESAPPPAAPATTADRLAAFVPAGAPSTGQAVAAADEAAASRARVDTFLASPPPAPAPTGPAWAIAVPRREAEQEVSTSDRP
jgi:hypothetical protein